jgi:hypothetical protein
VGQGLEGFIEKVSDFVARFLGVIGSVAFMAQITRPGFTHA